MRRTVNDIEALCKYEALHTDDPEMLFEEGQLIQMNCGLERLTRLACHGWLDWTNHDERYDGAPSRGTLTEQGAKMLTYYNRAWFDVIDDEKIVEDGVHPFLDRADAVWQQVVA